MKARTIAITLAFAASWMGLNAVLDGQPTELQAEQAVAEDTADAPLQARRLAQIDAAIERATGQPHPSTQRPLRRIHPSAARVVTVSSVSTQEVAR